MAERRRAGRLVVPPQAAPADKALLERSAIEELSHHADPWRVLRILSEFVEGFDALNDVGPAITVFGSARTKPTTLTTRPAATSGAPWLAVALRSSPAGGLGTLDELFESLTLAQTGKIEHFPIVLFGSAYWKGLLDWMRAVVLGHGAMSPDDFELVKVTDDPEEAAELATRPLPVEVDEP